MTAPAEDSDAELVRRSLAGDQRAFGQLARRYGPRLARTVRAMGVDASEVEDVVQNALVSAWRSLADYDGARPFLGWTCTIAMNKARDWNRQRKRRRAWREAPPLDTALSVEDPTAGPKAEELKDQMRRVEAAIRALPDALQTPLVMYVVAGLSQQEIARALGIGVSTVEQRLARARLALKQNSALTRVG